MLWFRTPSKIFFKPGCLATALEELKTVYNKKKVMLVTDGFLYQSGMADKLIRILDKLGIDTEVFSEVKSDPTLACARDGAKLAASFQPDTIIALGGGSPMDAAKIIWLLYEHPEADFSDMAMDFMDIRKRVCTFPHLGEKAMLVCVPTSAGTGSEVTPFAIITDEKDGTKYPITDYELLPNMAIVDSDLMLSIPKGLTRASGIDVDRIRLLSVIMSTWLAAVGILVYEQGFGFIQLYTAPNNMTLPAVAAILIGGASVNKASIPNVIIGTILFQGIVTMTPTVLNSLIHMDMSEVIRMIVSNGMILYALTRKTEGSK